MILRPALVEPYWRLDGILKYCHMWLHYTFSAGCNLFNVYIAAFSSLRDCLDESRHDRSPLKMPSTFYNHQKHYLCLKVIDLNVPPLTQKGARSPYRWPKFCTCFSCFLVKYLLSVWIGKGYFTPKANGDGFGWCLFVLLCDFIFLRNAQWVEVLSMPLPKGLFIKVPLRSVTLFCLFCGFMEALFAHL